jgi:EmrB/QacA subfamily drug resistance transporter
MAPSDRIPARTWKIAAVTGAGSLIAMLDATIANLAVEAVRVDFDASLTNVQWIATAYLVALAVSLPATGWLGEHWGHGRVWMAALATFVAGSALCALAPSPATLIAARVLQGLAAGLMIPSGQAVIASTAGRDQLGRIFGALGTVVVLGPALGPGVGGVLLEVASWRWLFWINVPIGLVALVAAARLIPDGSVTATRPLDRRGLALLAIGLPLLLYGATELGAGGETSLALPAVAAGMLLTAAFVVFALRTPHPIIDLQLLRSGTFATATATTGLTGASNFGGLLLLPLYLQLVADRGVTTTGLLLLVQGAGSGSVLYLGGRMTDRHGAGSVAVLGAWLLVLTTIPFLFVGTLSISVLAVLLLVRGIGLALTQMPATTAAYGAVEREQIGDAATLVNIVQRVGGAIGAASVVVVLAQAGGSASAGAFRWAFAVLLGISVVAVAVAWSLRRHTNPTQPMAAA